MILFYLEAQPYKSPLLWNGVLPSSIKVLVNKFSIVLDFWYQKMTGFVPCIWILIVRTCQGTAKIFDIFRYLNSPFSQTVVFVSCFKVSIQRVLFLIVSAIQMWVIFSWHWVFDCPREPKCCYYCQIPMSRLFFSGLTSATKVIVKKTLFFKDYWPKKQSFFSALESRWTTYARSVSDKGSFRFPISCFSKTKEFISFFKVSIWSFRLVSGYFVKNLWFFLELDTDGSEVRKNAIFWTCLDIQTHISPLL